MKKVLNLLLVGILSVTILFLAACQASNVFTYVIDESFDDYITMGTSADYPPYEWPMNVDGKQTIVGIDIEIAKAIALAVGKNLKVVNKSFDFLLDDLESGKVDFVIAGMTPTAARAEQVDFSTVYYEAVQVVLVAEANVSTFVSVEALDVATNRIGAQIGSIQQDLVTDTFLTAQTMFLTTIPDLVLKVQQGQLEALVVEGPVAAGYVENMEGLAIAPFTIGEPDGGSAVAVQKGNADLLATINTVLANLISTGALDQIIQEMVELNVPVTE